MNAAKNAIHTIRNDLTPILFLAELARTGDRKAAKLALSELMNRCHTIYEDLEILCRLLQKPDAGSPVNPERSCGRSRSALPG
jgi:hypothetical protein